MKSFKKLIEHYKDSSDKQKLHKRFGDIPIEDLILLDRLNKHLPHKNLHRMAEILSMYIFEYSIQKLPSKSKHIAYSVDLVLPNGVGGGERGGITGVPPQRQRVVGLVRMDSRSKEDLR